MSYVEFVKKNEGEMSTYSSVYKMYTISSC